MNEQWARQKREIDSYNLFFAAIKGEITGEGLSEAGYRLVGTFLRISDNRRDIEVEPDFVLFDGTTLLLVEAKAGSNINDGDIEQMERCADLSIEAAQEFLKDTSFDHSGYDPNELRTVQPCIVYPKETIEECKKHAACVDSLEELKSYSAVLTQEKGGQLELDGGDERDDEFASTLSNGIALPEAPAKNIYLNEQVEAECLAFSICHDCVVNNMVRGRMTLTPSGIRDRYQNRELPMRRVERVLKFLAEIGACRKTEDGEYEFTQAHMTAVLSVEEKLTEKPVSEWIDKEDAPQAGLDDFA
jgi:hypothetical protein